MNKKIGIIDVGGGTRGIYAAGVQDTLMDEGIQFEYGIGVSAGSANLASYFAGQKGRTFQFYDEYAFRPEYMGIRNFIKTGQYLGLDYIYDTLSNEGGERPLNYAALMKNPAELEIVVTNAMTGKPSYYSKGDMAQDDYSIIKASSAVPLAAKPCRLGTDFYFDGGLSDPIPFRRAMEQGCEKLVVILTRPRDFFRKPDKDLRFAKLIQKKYPGAASALAERSRVYNDSLRAVLELEQELRALIVAPRAEDIEGLGTLSQDKKKLEALYERGRRDGEAIGAFME